ncbi:MAG: hypothetical protein LBN18_00720 [Dysgonamonadaceae bacterium]|jgi:hypothetical protein|nr:hypothetical protein [Dysgonamonadaceae bacterium]
MKTENSDKLNGQKLGWFIFEAAMAALYILFAIIFLFPSWFHLHMAVQDGIRIALGAILGVYGVFRIYRVINKLR